MSDNTPQASGEFLLYQTEDGGTRVECRLANESLWLAQAGMAELFQTSKQNIAKHLKAIFAEGELAEDSVVNSWLATAADGKRYRVLHYNLATVLAVGYRVRSLRGTHASQPNMVLASFSGATPRRSDVAIDKNYLNADELDTLNRIVVAYLEFAELQARRRQTMTMQDWLRTLDDFLKLGGHQVLTHAGCISAEAARLKAETEYDHYRQQLEALPAPVEQDMTKALEAAANKLPRPKEKNKGKTLAAVGHQGSVAIFH